MIHHFKSTLFIDYLHGVYNEKRPSEIRCHRSKLGIPYGRAKYEEGDIVTIYLDLNKKQIHFGVNDKEYEIAYDKIETGQNISYYLGIACHEVGHQMKIIDFGYH